ncbi:MAG: DNA cytosine methyltransferase [Ruminococcus sp.]|nr:DNA cytosine methyltransferase [Ruminococcus sp.]
MKDSNFAQLSFTQEIFVDNFAGGGGASTGIELATGLPVTVAINHDPDAIAMHMVNHPYTDHYQESVWAIDPVDVCKGRPVGLAWFSPDCRHFSRAKGSAPVSKQIRGLAWITLRWAAKVRPRVIILENVPEFQTWGPVRHGKPVKAKQGQTFGEFVSQLRELGYAVEYKELRACDYGAPTIRNRFFLVARCDGKPIVFPKPTHGVGKGLKPYRTAAECIDWTIPCKSIFGRKKPLAENTMRRIARGLDKFTIKNAAPFIVTVNHSGDGFRGSGIDKPLNTLTAYRSDGVVEPALTPYNSKSGKILMSPHISKYYGNIIGSPADEPLHTVTVIDHNALSAGYLIQYHSETAKSEVRGQELTEPVMTVDSSPRYGLISANLIKYYSGDHSSDICEPLHTITAKDRHGLVEVRIEPIDNSVSDLGNWQEIRRLLNTYCGYELNPDEIILFKIDGKDHFLSDIGLRMLEPRELYNAQGFPPDYIIDTDCSGKAYNRTKQVARCGNAVPPPFAEALVRANLPEYCGDRISTMRELKSRQAV